jgi:hypothetical protein
VDAWHRGDLALDVGAVDHEQRLDEVAGVQAVLAGQPADPGRSAQAAGPLIRSGRVRHCAVTERRSQGMGRFKATLEDAVSEGAVME